MYARHNKLNADVMDVVDCILLQLPEYLTPADFGHGIDTGWRKHLHSQSSPCTPDFNVECRWRNMLRQVRVVVNPAALRPNRDLGIHTSRTMTHAHTVCNIEAGGVNGGGRCEVYFRELGAWPAMRACCAGNMKLVYHVGCCEYAGVKSSGNRREGSLKSCFPSRLGYVLVTQTAIRLYHEHAGAWVPQFRPACAPELRSRRV